MGGMYTTREGDWFITTPIYVGDQQAVAAAMKCQHEWWTDEKSKEKRVVDFNGK